MVVQAFLKGMKKRQRKSAEREMEWLKKRTKQVAKEIENYKEEPEKKVTTIEGKVIEEIEPTTSLDEQELLLKWEVVSERWIKSKFATHHRYHMQTSDRIRNIEDNMNTMIDRMDKFENDLKYHEALIAQNLIKENKLEKPKPKLDSKMDEDIKDEKEFKQLGFLNEQH